MERDDDNDGRPSWARVAATPPPSSAPKRHITQMTVGDILRLGAGAGPSSFSEQKTLYAAPRTGALGDSVPLVDPYTGKPIDPPQADRPRLRTYEITPDRRVMLELVRRMEAARLDRAQYVEDGEFTYVFVDIEDAERHRPGGVQSAIDVLRQKVPGAALEHGPHPPARMVLLGPPLSCPHCRPRVRLVVQTPDEDMVKEMMTARSLADPEKPPDPRAGVKFAAPVPRHQARMDE